MASPVRPHRMPADAAPGYRQIWSLAWPIILANSAVPLLGLTDTAVIGHTGSAEDLGAIAFGALIFNFVYWSFGFLRMGTTGFVARAHGAGDEAEVRAALGRALLLAVGIALLLWLLQWPILHLALNLLSGSDAVESLTAGYFSIRIWGAPAGLAVYALMGLLLGLARSRGLLVLQLLLNGSNIVLDILFAGVFGWGVAGIALGTALAEWLTAGIGGVMVWSLLRRRHADAEPFLPLLRLRQLAALRQTLAANTDIMLRTLLLIFSFAWFINQGAAFGDTVLAANHILLQFIAFSAFFLDGYAHAAEPIVGRAVGSGRRQLFDLAVRRSSVLAAATAAALALGLWLFGPLLIAGLTVIEEVRAAARLQLPLVAAYVLLSFAAFQLDGIFIGAGWTRTMRNASAVSMLVFLLLAVPLTAVAGNRGLWLAFCTYVVARAVALGIGLPALRAGIGETRTQ